MKALAEALPVGVEEVISMTKWKTEAYKKKPMRERLRLEGAGDATTFGNIPSGRMGVALDRAVDRFIREGSCRHKQSLGSPCVSFDASTEGICKRDGRICDLLTEKGERYRREYE
jgi:hypothetical protein